MGENLIMDSDFNFSKLKIGIIGLGLIGGSLARALRNLYVNKIVAVDQSATCIEQALAEGIIDNGDANLSEVIFSCDVIFICTPVSHTASYLAHLSQYVKQDCIITDVGSTKAAIMEYVENLDNAITFIGGHPMAGTEKSGYDAGYSHLFENAYYILTPCKNVKIEQLEFVKVLVTKIGAIPVIMDPIEHDRVAGAISHVPHIIASALVNMVKACDASNGIMQMLAAGGFKDITRIASSNPYMWQSITMNNSAFIISLLEKYSDLLLEIRDEIYNKDAAALLDFFQNAKAYRELFSSSQKGSILPIYEIKVDVPDKPGIIGEIATLLGYGGINIKNMNISNSREFEQGCLTITLPDNSSKDKAFEILINSGHKAYRNI